MHDDDDHSNGFDLGSIDEGSSEGGARPQPDALPGVLARTRRWSKRGTWPPARNGSSFGAMACPSWHYAIVAMAGGSSPADAIQTARNGRTRSSDDAPLANAGTLSPVIRALRFAGEEVQLGSVLEALCQAPNGKREQ